jgi:hypothetical protein
MSTFFQLFLQLDDSRRHFFDDSSDNVEIVLSKKRNIRSNQELN